MLKILKYNILARSHDPELFMQGNLIGCQAPSGKSPLNESRHPLTAGLILVDNKRNKSDKGSEYFISYPYFLWEMIQKCKNNNFPAAPAGNVPEHKGYFHV